MKTLYLLRHAKSSWGDMTLDDFDRPLSDRGRRAGKLMGQHLKENGLIAGLILCSSANRTRQTLKRLQKNIGDEIPVRFDKDLYLASSREMLNILRRTDDAVSSVMMIGHNPGAQMLSLDLTESGDKEAWERMSQKYPTAALAVLTSDVKRWRDFGACNLESFVLPRDLE